MQDQILKSYLDDFSSRFNHTDSAEYLQFEYFVAHCIVAKDYQGHFDSSALTADDATGIDSVAIFVNDSLIESPTEIQSFEKRNLDVKFVFIQTKTSNSYDLGDVLKFTLAVKHFFSRDEKSGEYALIDAHEIKEAIYKRAIKFIDNPTVELYYATTSSNEPNELMTSTANTEIAALSSTNLFSNVIFKFITSEELKSAYRTLSHKVTKQITFEKHTILPKIHGVKRAFIGILPCKEYLKLICDSDGKLLKNVFYDNVRDFQGENSVNREILSTITAEEFGKETFVLLNNGVTVVSKSVNPVGIEFTVRDFQVVNGCQTSHVLHKNAALLSGNEFITIKLIETEDADLTNKITKATNRQTEVKLEAFAGLQPFHKELEAFYASQPITERLFYERRPGQYDFDSSINQSKVVSIPSQIKSFVSVFLEEPQKIHFYYGQLLEDYSSGDESVLFSETHAPHPYFLSSRLIFMVNQRLKRGDKEHGKWKYHLAAMVRMLILGPFPKSRLSDTNFCRKYCDNLGEKLQNFNEYFDTAISILEGCIPVQSQRSPNIRDLPQNANIASKLISESREVFSKNNRNNTSPIAAEHFDGTFVGKINQLIAAQNLGLIEYGHRKFFFRYKDTGLLAGQKVHFKVKKVGDANEAFDVVPI